MIHTMKLDGIAEHFLTQLGVAAEAAAHNKVLSSMANNADLLCVNVGALQLQHILILLMKRVGLLQRLLVHL